MGASTSSRELAIEVPKSCLRSGKFAEFSPASKLSSLVTVNSFSGFVAEVAAVGVDGAAEDEFSGFVAEVAAVGVDGATEDEFSGFVLEVAAVDVDGAAVDEFSHPSHVTFVTDRKFTPASSSDSILLN